MAPAILQYWFCKNPLFHKTYEKHGQQKVCPNFSTGHLITAMYIKQIRLFLKWQSDFCFIIFNIPASFRICKWWDTAGLDRCVFSVIAFTRTPLQSPIFIISKIICCLFSSSSASRIFWHRSKSAASLSISFFVCIILPHAQLLLQSDIWQFQCQS